MAGMQVAWFFWAMALAAHSRAAPGGVLPLRCFTCGNDTGACAAIAETDGGAGTSDFSGQAVLCPQEQPYCATRASSPNFTSVLSCSSAIEGVCSLSHSVKGKYEMICVCSTPLCNAPFSHQMQIELIKYEYKTYNSPTKGNQFNEMFWKLSHLANRSDANIYNKVTEEIRGVTEATPAPRREGLEWKTTRTVAVSTMSPEGYSQRHVDPKETQNAEVHQAESLHNIEQKMEVPQSQALRHVEAQVVISEHQAEKPRAQAVRQLPPTSAPSDDDEDEGEGSGADEEAPGRRPQLTGPAAAAAAPGSFLPADGENSGPLPYFNPFLILPLLLYTIV